MCPRRIRILQSVWIRMGHISDACIYEFLPFSFAIGSFATYALPFTGCKLFLNMGR